MFNLRVKTKVTFSFSKLSKKLETLLPQTERTNLRDVANQFKKNIIEGKFKPLAPATQKRRKYKGYNPHYPRTKPKTTNTPLIATGNLLKSIRVTKKGVTFNKYGDYHVKGGTNLPKRNWMAGTVRTESGAAKSAPKGFRKSTILSDKNLKRLKEGIRKGFRLAGRGKNIRDIRL
tara:strand:+ start:350 stop:874 length:525 start_codon:yes stop_codon:yes gene_type:complete